MMVTYVRVQLLPSNQPAWFSIPVEHVLNLVMRSEQSSALDIYQGELKIGTVYVRPVLDDAGEPTNAIMVNGEVTVKLPGVRKRIIFRSRYKFADGYQRLLEFESGIRMRNPDFELELSSAAGSDIISYRATGENDQIISEGAGTVAEILAASPLGEAGLSVDALQQVSASTLQPTARRATTQLGTQKIEVYRITIPQGANTHLEIDVSQLGRIVAVNSPYGIKLYSEGLKL